MNRSALLMLLALGGAFASSDVSAETKDARYFGVYVLAGQARQSDIQRQPEQPTALSDRTDTSGLNGGAGVWLGYDWSERGTPLRTELSLTWRYRHDLNVLYDVGAGPAPGQYHLKADVAVVDLMASALYLFETDGNWQPYIGLGAGIAHYDADSYVLYGNGKSNGMAASNSEFAWQVQGGVDYPINDQWDLRMEYRYVDLGTVEVGEQVTGDRFSADLASHDVRIGISYRF